MQVLIALLTIPDYNKILTFKQLLCIIHQYIYW